MPLFRATRDLGERGQVIVPLGTVVEIELHTTFAFEVTWPNHNPPPMPRTRIHPPPEGNNRWTIPASLLHEWSLGLVPFQDDYQTLAQQVNRLAAFITEEVPGEPSQGQGACDTAIRIIRTLMEMKNIPKPLPPIDREGLPTLWDRIDSV